MLKSIRHISWAFSIALHLLIFFAGLYVAVNDSVKIDLDKRVYEVSLVGPAHKGKPGVRSAPKSSSLAQETEKKAVPKEAPPEKTSEEPKKAVKKEAPKEAPKEANAIPLDTTNATKEAEKKEAEKKEAEKKEAEKKEAEKKEAEKKEAEKKEAEKKEAEKKEAQKKEAAAKAAAANATKEKGPSREEILKQALNSAKSQAGTVDSDNKGSGRGAAKGGDSKGTARNAVADALAAAKGEISGRGTTGTGTSGDGDGEGESAGTLEDWYKTKVSDAIRANWRFQRLNELIKAQVEIKVNKSGEILSSRLIHGSGRADFDASVLRAIEETKKFEPLPDGLEPTFMLTFYNKEHD